MGARFIAETVDGHWTVIDHADRYVVHQREWDEPTARDIADGLNEGTLHVITFTWEVEST